MANQYAGTTEAIEKPLLRFELATDNEQQPASNEMEGNKTLWEQWLELVEAAGAPHGVNELVARDAALAQRIAQQPGELEARLLEGIGELAQRRCADPSYPSLLAFVLNQRVESDVPPPRIPLFPASSFALTLRALSPEGFLCFLVAARTSRYKSGLGTMAMQNSIELAKWYLAHSGGRLLEKVTMAPELRDVLRDAPLPDILPENVAALSVTEIAEIITRYTGEPIEQIEARMRPGAASSSGFLGHGESLAEVIHRDAQTLASIGVDRHALADRIELLISAHFHNEMIDGWPTQEQIKRSPTYYDARWFAAHEARKRRLIAGLGEPTGPQGRFELRWRISVLRWCGHQQDPFHSADVYWRTQCGACDIEIEHRDRPGVVLHFGDLVVVLIRRACFFEGTVSYRLDPEKAAWVLALTDQPPSASN